MDANIIEKTGLSDAKISTLLQVKTTTIKRWRREGHVPHQAGLILRSVALGLPILMSRSEQWDGHRFRPTGELETPTGYAIYPCDLWLFEFMQRNQMTRVAKQIIEDSRQNAVIDHRAANDDAPQIG